MIIYNNTNVCEGCPNNPKINPTIVGVCHCILPYTTPTTNDPFGDSEEFHSYTIIITDNTSGR